MVQLNWSFWCQLMFISDANLNHRAPCQPNNTVSPSSNYSNYAGPCFFLPGIDMLCWLFVMSQPFYDDEIQHLYSTTVTRPLSMRMVNNRIILFMIVCGFWKSEQTKNINERKISISCFEEARKLIKTLYSDIRSLEKQYQRIEKNLRIMGKMIM